MASIRRTELKGFDKITDRSNSVIVFSFSFLPEIAIKGIPLSDSFIATGSVVHRSKNMLSVVQGIARLTASDPKDFMNQFTARLSAVCANQAILIDDEWTSKNMAHLTCTQM